MSIWQGRLLSGVISGLFLMAVSGARPAAVTQARESPSQGGQSQGQVEEPEVVSDDEIERYRVAAEGSEKAIDHYNYGTALLSAGHWEEAREELRRAAETGADSLATFARYNDGLASAKWDREGDGEGAHEGATELLVEARDAFREVLRKETEDEDARWNLELVERWMHEDPDPDPDPSGGGGGGGGGGGNDGGGGGGGGGRGSGGGGGGSGSDSDSPSELSDAQARTMLAQAGLAEQPVRDRLLGQASQRGPGADKNW